MAINLSNVNISIRAFQAVAKGDHNAGEVRLTSETSIDKVNHHVSLRRLNNVSLSHEEVLAIKNAFVKALKDGGVGIDELNRVRQELGLAPMKPVDVNLHARSIRPLSRQQIREILDRNAETINTRLGAGTIRVSDEIYARVNPRDLETRRTERDVANAELDTRRNTVENRQINLVQSMLAGDVDFYSQDMRREMLDMAKSCLDSVLAACNARPRENSMASIAMNSANGKKVVLSSGLSERAFVRKLEDIIVRLSMSDGPGDDQLAVRAAFKALETAEARATWATNLLNDPQGAFKARVAAVMILHDRGIDDFETLSVVNHLKKNDAIVFLANLVSGGMGLEGDALRQSAPVQTALAAADAAFTAEDGAYIPALSNQQFNAEIASNMAHSPEKLPVTYQLLQNATKDMVRARYGDYGYPINADPTWLTAGTSMETLTGAADPNAPRITPETLRDGYTQAAVNASARRVFEAGVVARLANMEPKVSNPMTVAHALMASEPDIMTGIQAAQSPEAAEAVLDGYTELLAACVRRVATDERRQAELEAQTVNTATNAFLTGQGAARALEAGFVRAELPQIAKTFALCKVAMNATDEVALAAALDSTSNASRLVSYGGRFIANAENFKAGLKLLDAFEAWFPPTRANAYSKNFTTTTERFLNIGVVSADAGRAMENFLFAEIAANASISLDDMNPEAVFGMANNPAMRFVGRGYTTSCANSLAQIPQEKRDLIYAVFDAFDPLPEGAAGAGKRHPVSQSALLAARIMKNFAAVVALRQTGNLDRAHLVPLLYGDLGVAPTATNQEIDQAYTRALVASGPLAGLAHMMLLENGTTIPETLAALHEGRRLPNAPGISSFNGHLEGVDGSAKEGRATLVGDLIRPERATFTGNKVPALPLANVVFKFHFPDNVTLNSKTDNNGNEDVESAAKDIADKIETLCGKVHQKQLNAVYFALTQSAVGVNVNGGFLPYGITSNEHMALTFTLEKDTETGDVKIRYSEPEGFPLHFSWETTIHLDGASETTPMVVDVPQGLEYKALAGENGSVPFTSGTVAPGNGPVATTMRNLIDTRCGAPENATANEKALAFQNKVDPMATKNMVYTLARVANSNLVSNAGGQKHLDFEAVNYQFNRDLLGGYKFFFPGVKGHSGDYNTNRDRLVKFVTDDANATFATASAETKRRVGVLMAFLTQNTYAVPTDSVAGAIAPPGGAVAFQPVIFGGNKPEFRLSKDEAGNIKINVVGRDNLQGCIMIGEGDDSSVVMLREGSYSTFKMQITIPKENLESLADVDWTQYDRSVAHGYDGDLDGRIALIPERYRFTGTVKLSYHMHLNEAQ